MYDVRTIFLYVVQYIQVVVSCARNRVIRMKIRKISLNKVGTNHNTVNVPVRRPHDHKYVNQESFRRFYVYVIKRLCD